MSLSTILGSVCDLKISRATYEDVVFTPGASSGSGAAANGAVMLGELANAAILSSTTASGEDITRTGFTCTVNGVHVVGAFVEIGFCEGEVIEFVGEMDRGKFLAVAARSALRQLIWISPHHDCGHTAFARKSMRWCLVFSLFFAFAVSAMWAAITGLSPRVPIEVTASLPAMGFTMSMMITLWLRAQITQSSKNATLIFRALGFTLPGEVDLHANHELADLRFRQAGDPNTPSFGLWCYRY